MPVTNSPKDLILRALSSLPDDASFEDLLDRLDATMTFWTRVRDLDPATCVPHAEAMRRLEEMKRKWQR